MNTKEAIENTENQGTTEVVTETTISLTAEQVLGALSNLSHEDLLALMNKGREELDKAVVLPREVEVAEVIRRSIEKMAKGKEAHYFWDKPKYQADKDNLIKTLCVLASKQKSDDKIETQAGKYEVNQYKVPSAPWLSTFVNFGHRVYVSPTQKKASDWLQIKERPNNWELLPGRILSPEGLVEVYNRPAENNDVWLKLSPVNKSPKSLESLNGLFTSNGEYYVWDENKDVYFAQYLGLEFDGLSPFMGQHKAVSSIDALIDQLCDSTVPAEDSNQEG